MSKYQDALNELYKQRRKRYKVHQKHEKWNEEIKEYDKVGDCLQTLQELVNKETPMKPIATEYFTKRYDAHNSYVFPIYMCPICNEPFSDDIPKYCPGCGQKLDWSDENAT